MTSINVPDFKTFTFPVIRGGSKKPGPPRDPHKYSPVLTKARCPGCCGPVFAQFFDGYDYGDKKKGDYYAYTCGTLELKLNGTHRYISHKIGPHGTLAYVEFADERKLQDALDEEFEKRQVDRDLALKEFEASGADYVETHGCFPGVTRRYVPQGKLKATEHKVDCVCINPDSL